MGRRAFLVWLTMLFLPQTLQAQDPTVRAQILSLDTVSGDYTPLPEARVVTINITVDSNRFGIVTHHVDNDGFVSFSVPSGRPFSVIFHGGNRVPEITELAGTPDGRNVLYVCLLTVTQYVERHGRLAYTKLTAMREELQAMWEADSVGPELDELLRELQELIGSIG